MPFFLDIETISTKANAAILSVGCVYVDASKPTTTYEEILSKSIYIKFEVKDQVDRLHRHVEKRTVDWWMKQAPMVRDFAMKPTSRDVKVEIGLGILERGLTKPERPVTNSVGFAVSWTPQHLKI